jgi:hypothetical protein
MSATLRRHLHGAAAGGLVALAIAGCSSSPSAETTSPGGTAGGAVARWQKAVTPVELATIRNALSVEFTTLGSAVAATSNSPDSANLAALHQACAALSASATADATLPIPTVSLQRTWETAIRLVGTGAAECLNGITDIRTPILKQGIVRMAQGEHGLRQVLDHR